LCLSRLSYFGAGEMSIVTNAGIFFGSITGFTAKIILSYSSLSPISKNINQKFQFASGLFKMQYSHIYFGMIAMLICLTIERFIYLFNAPFFREMGIQELFYLPGLSSTSAFGLSMDIIIGILFPIIYLYVEESSFFNQTNFSRDLFTGLKYTFVIQISVILVQTFYDIHFFAQYTNQSDTFDRATGFFRDTGSATLITAVGLLFFYQKKLETLQKINSKYIIFSLLAFLFICVIGWKMGRFYWLYIFLLFPILFLRHSYKLNKEIGVSKNFYKLTLSSLLLLIISIFLFVNYSPLKNRIDENIANFHDKQSLEEKFAAIDPPRYFLNKASLKLFTDSPVFGNGFSSLMVELGDPNFPIINPKHYRDNSGNFLLGLLADVGFLGAVVPIMWILGNLYFRKNYLIQLMLIPTYMFGYHIVHPDSAFFLLLLTSSISPSKRENNYFSTAINWVSVLIGLCFLGNLTSKVQKEERGPLFRYDKIGNYQMFPYELNRTAEKSILGEGEKQKIEYHNFRGKVIWKLGESVLLKPSAFLSDSTSKSYLRQKWTFLDKHQLPMENNIIIIERYKVSSNEWAIPINAEFLQVEELDENDKPKLYGDTIFSVLKERFGTHNEFK
jgi:hypothetical protein